MRADQLFTRIDMVSYVAIFFRTDWLFDVNASMLAESVDLHMGIPSLWDKVMIIFYFKRDLKLLALLHLHVCRTYMYVSVNNVTLQVDFHIRYWSKLLQLSVRKKHYYILWTTTWKKHDLALENPFRLYPDMKRNFLKRIRSRDFLNVKCWPLDGGGGQVSP